PAVYSGDPCYAPSASVQYDQAITPATPAVTLRSDADPSPCGATVTLTASVTPTSATGNVQFMDGATALGSAPVTAGSATLPANGLVVGGHLLTALYSGEAHYAPIASPTLAQTVTLAASAVTLASDANPSVFGGGVLTATVSPPDAGGAVRFMDSLTVIGETPVTAGVATLSIATLAGG